jgi:hypothetical protein
MKICSFKNVLVIAFILFICFGLKNVDNFQDYNFTVIVESQKYNDSNKLELLKGEKIAEEFKAKYNNLGIIAIKFDTHFKVNNDYLQFKIKEKNSVDWYYVNSYKVDQFRNNEYFPFGFPEIKESKNKN